MSSPLASRPSRKTLETPPSSDNEPDPSLPPSPPLSRTSQELQCQPRPRPAVDRIFGILKLREAGRYREERYWRQFRLSSEQYAELQRRIEADGRLWGFYHDKVRDEWDPEAGVYVLRMPSAVHERLLAKVEDRVIKGIEQLADGIAESEEEGWKATAKELRRIDKGRSTTIHLQGPRLVNSSPSPSQDGGDGEKDEKPVGFKSPDCTFYHPAQRLQPIVVIEAAYSQSEKDLATLADRYIVGSRHKIRTVIGLELPYIAEKRLTKGTADTDKSAIVSLWQPGFKRGADGSVKGICKLETRTSFRSTGGAAVDANFRIRASDLLPLSVSKKLPHGALQQELTIPYAELSAYLTGAESFVSADTGVTETSPSPSEADSFEFRERTPDEELSDSREEAFLRQELAQHEKDEAADGEWKSRARSQRRNSTAAAADTAAVVEVRRSPRIRESGG